MKAANILIIGGGIGGLTATIALRRQGFEVDVVERDPAWSVYGVGIIQQPNVVRAMSQLGILKEYVEAGFGFDHVDVYGWNGVHFARVKTPGLVEGAPASLGITRPALQKVLADCAKAAGGRVRLGDTVTALDQDASGVDVAFASGAKARYDIVVGADGTYSATREMIFADAPEPEFTGQGVWRYNLPRPSDMDGFITWQGDGRVSAGLTPMTRELVYLFVTTAEPGNPRYERAGLAKRLREKITNPPAKLAELTQQITDDDAVVYRPLDYLFLYGPWHKGRVVLLGDAVHSTTPHLGQGAGLAIEDSLVLADELARADTAEQGFAAYRERRFERCRYIVESSRAICDGQLGKRPPVNHAKASAEMLALVAQPI
jgi:2-polyprenyl-6-methoxyphenol hydroxylase-like FAD-dependent oxidoreductase